MPIGSLLLIAALVFIVIIYLATPFFSSTENWGKESSLRSSLLAEKERILEAILELESDYKMGKVPEEVFQEQRPSLLESGAKVLSQLGKNPAKDSSDEALEEMIALHKFK